MYMERKQSNKRTMKIIRLTGIYAAIAFAVCFIILFNLNNSIVFADTSDSSQTVAASAKAVVSASGVSAEASVEPSATMQMIANITGIPSDAQELSFSYDDKYCTYMVQSQLYVTDIQTGKTLKTITDSGITSPILMNDRNVLMYFTVSGGSAVLSTYNIDSDQATKQASFTMSSGSKIKAVDYSNATNLVFVNLEKTTNGTVSDTVYSINIMKNVSKLSLTSVVDNMVLMGKINSLYYEDAKNNLYLHAKPFAGLKTGILLGLDAEDNVYVQSPSDKNSVSVIVNEKVAKTLTLTDPNYIRFYANKNSVYIVYSDSIINLSGNITAKMQFDKGLKFLGLGGANAYFRDADNNIIGLKITI